MSKIGVNMTKREKLGKVFWVKEYMKELHNTSSPFLTGELDILLRKVNKAEQADLERVKEILKHRITTRYYQAEKLIRIIAKIEELLK